MPREGQERESLLGLMQQEGQFGTVVHQALLGVIQGWESKQKKKPGGGWPDDGEVQSD